MNSNEPFSNVQNTSEIFRSLLQSSEDSSDLQSTSKRTGSVGRGRKYAGAEIPDQDLGHDFLIMEEAYTLFESQGERRSLRMIGEYCKTGELICSYDSDDKRWHITRESVENKISKIKALNARKAATAPQSTSENFSEAPATPHQATHETPPRATEEAPPRNEAVSPPSEDTTKLQKEIYDLKVANAGKDYYIDRLLEERKDFITRIETSNRLVGRLKNRLLQLMAPGTARDIDVLPAPSDMPSDPPTSKGSQDTPLSDRPNDQYEHSSQQSYTPEQR